MRHIYIRPLRLYDDLDKAAFIEAADKSGKEFPVQLFTLASTRIMVACTIEGGKERIIGYQPQFTSMTLGSLIVPGDPTESEMASAQHQFTAAAFTRAHSEGFADVIAFSHTPETREFALRHGFIADDRALRLEVR